MMETTDAETETEQTTIDTFEGETVDEDQIDEGDELEIRYCSDQAQRLITDTFTVEYYMTDINGQVEFMEIARDGTTYEVYPGDSEGEGATIFGRNARGKVYDLGRLDQITITGEVATETDDVETDTSAAAPDDETVVDDRSELEEGDEITITYDSVYTAGTVTKTVDVVDVHPLMSWNEHPSIRVERDDGQHLHVSSDGNVVTPDEFDNYGDRVKRRRTIGHGVVITTEADTEDEDEIRTDGGLTATDFETGESVEHDALGAGVVIDRDAALSSIRVQFANDDRPTVIARLERLEKVGSLPVPATPNAPDVAGPGRCRLIADGGQPAPGVGDRVTVEYTIQRGPRHGDDGRLTGEITEIGDGHFLFEWGTAAPSTARVDGDGSLYLGTEADVRDQFGTDVSVSEGWGLPAEETVEHAPAAVVGGDRSE